MSAGVSDQRMKGQGNQVTNGPKDHVNEHEDFDSWRTHHQVENTKMNGLDAKKNRNNRNGVVEKRFYYHDSAQLPGPGITPMGYNTPISTSMAAAAAASDPYMSNYYGTSFPYQAFGVGDGTWSNGGDPMTFLGSYGQQMGHDSYAASMDGMFGGGGGGFGGAFGQPAAPAPSFNYFHGNGDYSTWGGSAPQPQPSMARKQHYDDYYRDNMYGAGMDQLKTVEQSMQGLSLCDPKDGKEQLGGGGGSSAPKKQTWAAVASQPAKPQPQLGSTGTKKKGPGAPPPPVVPGKHNMDIGTWETKNNGVAKAAPPPPAAAAPIRPTWNPVRAPPPQPQPPPPPPHIHVLAAPPPPPVMHLPPPMQPLPSHPILDELRVKNNYNPVDFDLSAKEARFFVIKSYSEDDIHRSIKYEIWCSTEHGNKRLDEAYREREAKSGQVLLFFSVNGSGHFCGMARMSSPVDYRSSSSVWAQDKWKGKFKVRWIYVKDVPNAQLRHIRLENNENKPVTNSRDTQEVPPDKGRQVLKVLHQFRHSTSIFDDFVHYEKRQEEEDSRKEAAPPQPPPPQPPHQQQPPPAASNHHSANMRQHGHHKDRDSGSGGRGGGRGGRGGGGGGGGVRNN
ncbi:hypothetical protein LSTR_LSTR013634 [Laodelphax striatellus]|uniref:YTH domain-containing protein n=1 Tax=Laodelphax striatellus TaxID=195883 RepID=A0A482WRR1_LAOST|nr:hypothetical protein LSTR_LSTR013634 [Laodelphax striatellus]